MSETEGVKVLLGNQRKGILALSVPIAIALLAQNLNNIVDSFWVADLGQNAIAALGIVFPIYSILIGIGNGIGIGVSSAIARSIGVNDHERANGIASQALILTIFVSIAMTILLIFTAEPVIRLMGGKDMMNECMAYALPNYIGAFFIILSGVLSGMLRGEGAAKRSMMIQVAGAIVNVVLDPILIFGLGMGIAGAAWATIVAFVISCAIAFWWYFKGDSLYISIRKKDMRFNKEYQKDILSVGLPESIELTVMNFFNIFLNYFVIVAAGTAGLAVYTMVWRVGYFALVPAQAMGGAMVAICSAEYGMKRFDMIVDSFKFTIKRSLMWMIALCIALVVLAGPIADIFLRTGDVSGMRSDMIMFTYFFSLYIPMMAMIFIGSSLMQSIKKAGQAMINTLARNILVTAAYGIAAVTIGGLYGIGVALVVVEVIGAAAMLIHATIALNKTIKQFDGTDIPPA